MGKDEKRREELELLKKRHYVVKVNVEHLNLYNGVTYASSVSGGAAAIGSNCCINHKEAKRDDEDENNILKCKYAALHSELASSRKENSVLKKKIRRDAQLRKELSTVKREKAAIERNFQHQQECMIQENHQLLKDLSKEKKEKAILDKKFQELTLSVAQKESQLRKEISRVEKEKAVIETKLKKLQDIVKVCEDRLEEITNNLNTTKNDLAIRLVLADNF